MALRKCMKCKSSDSVKTEIHLLDFLGLIFLNIFRLNEGGRTAHFQYSLPGELMDREAWWATSIGSKSWTRLEPITLPLSKSSPGRTLPPCL